MDPGPTPTLTASTPASISACAPSRVATLPPIISTPLNAGSAFSLAIISSISLAWPWAVSTTSTSTPASTKAVQRCHASPKNPTAAATRNRPWLSFVASGYCSVLTKSLTVIRPVSFPSPSTSGSFSILFAARILCASSFEIAEGPVIRPSFVITSRTRSFS